MDSSCLSPQWQHAFCCGISSVWAKAIWPGGSQVPGEVGLVGCLDVIPFSLKHIFLSFSSAICSLSATSQVALAPKSRSPKDHDQRECLAPSADHLPRKMPQWAWLPLPFPMSRVLHNFLFFSLVPAPGISLCY